MPATFRFVAASWFIAGVRPVWRICVLSIVLPLAISAAWGFLPRLPGLFRPLQFGEDPWVPWIVMAVFVWSAIAVPVGAASVLVFYKVRKRGSNEKSAS